MKPHPWSITLFSENLNWDMSCVSGANIKTQEGKVFSAPNLFHGCILQLPFILLLRLFVKQAAVIVTNLQFYHDFIANLFTI